MGVDCTLMCGVLAAELRTIDDVVGHGNIMIFFIDEVKNGSLALGLGCNDHLLSLASDLFLSLLIVRNCQYSLSH